MASAAAPQAYAIHRQDIQAAIAKAEELRALHAALLQGGAAAGSPVALRLPLGAAASPSVSRASHQFASEDYPVFTPSYEEEPLHGYQFSRTESRTLSESLSRVGLEGEEHDVKEDMFDDKREINYSPMHRGVELYSTPDCQESKPSPCVNHVALQKISPGTETLMSIRRTGSEEFRTVATCNKCKPATISRGPDGDSRNYKNNVAAVHKTDGQPSLKLHQKSRGAVLSWLFPRFKKKPKPEMSPNTLESEDMSQLFKDWGLCSLETLKKELIMANENRDAALAEVGEMKSSLQELKQKLVHLEAYCEELKKALKQAMQGKKCRYMEKHDLTKRMKFTGIGEDSSMPVTHEVMVEGFLQIASESRLSVRQFCKTLLSQIDGADSDLVEKLNVLLRPHHPTLNSRYSKGLLYHLEALINQTLYQDFENCVFQKNGSPKVLDPQQDRLQNFSAFAALRNLSWNEVLRKGTKYYSEEFSRFCDQKMSSIVSVMDWSRPWPEQLLHSFFVAAKCIWLLHLLAFSFSPPLSILRVDEHISFDPIYMEDVLMDRQRPQAPARVKIMVMPGFYVRDKALRCKVLCSYRWDPWVTRAAPIKRRGGGQPTGQATLIFTSRSGWRWEMAGKSNRGKSRAKATGSKQANPSEPDAKPVDSSSSPTAVASEPSPSVHADGSAVGAVNGGGGVPETNEAAEDKGQDAGAPPAASKQEGELQLFPVSVKTQSGEKLELQLSPRDSVMDVRQFLLDAPETCFFTCYDLILNSKDGAVHLEDYNEISEVADITAGGCSLEMVSALYDDRSIRSHVRRTRELLSSANVHTSLSTLLALQHENAPKKTADSVKAEAPEADGLGFMEDVTGSICNLVSASPKDIKCLKTIVFSSFNPPPSYRRLVGDLLYLDVVTLEGTKYCITGSTQAFFVNASIGDVLDPRPGRLAFEATTLIGVLQKASPMFKKGFREILEHKASAHPFENVQSLLPPNTWLGIHPIPAHRRDAARAEDALALSFGSELIGMQRDWNEELQSCREFPHKTPQERILRDRALYKVTCDFVDAAISGAIGVISRCIPPINPTDPECFHMYVHNNIFFSFAVDAELGQISKDSSLNNKSSFWQASSANNSSHPLEKSSSPNAEDVHDAADANSDITTEVQMPDSEQATYASANNDLKGTKAYQEADVPGLYNLAMAIIDYRGYRVVAQSIIPGILQGDKSDSLLYGSVDNGKKICWNKTFHSKVLEAAKHLHLKEHTVLDGSGNVVKLAAPVECKGIVGSDDRHYLLDLMRVTPRDANYSGPTSRFCVLRPELVASFCQAEAAERSRSSNAGGEVHAEPDAENAGSSKPDVTTTQVLKNDPEECNETGESKPSCEEILLNPNVFTEFKLAGSEEEIAGDEANVKKAGSYLLDVVIPRFVKDLCNLEVSPMDGQTLTDALHAHGINIRYLGKVAVMITNLPHLWDMFTTEIIVRSAKHIFKDILRESQDHELGFAISHFLNCFIGTVSCADSQVRGSNILLKTQKKEQGRSHLPHKPSRGQKLNGMKSQAIHMQATTEALWFWIQQFAKFKFQFELPEDSRLRVKKFSVIRNLCQKVGVSIAARKYDLHAEVPFQTSDILDLQPVVKHSVPLCSEARDLMEAGKLRLAEGMLNEAYTLFSEAFLMLQQVTGPMHREVANCCRYLAMVLYHAGDMPGAIMQQHKELIINERCLGLDHPDTAHSYGNMALFYHGLNQTELALRHMSRTLLLLSLSSGPDHPDVAATFINVAMMYQDIGKMNTALRYLQEALKKNEQLLGQEHIQTAVCYHALAIAFNCMGAYKLSTQHEKRTYDILVKQLGEEDPRTRDSDNWIKTFKMRDLQSNAQKQKGQDANSMSAQKAIDILKAAAAVNPNASAASINKSLSAALVGEAIPRGRGTDERAARAAAEIRKKAAARGLLVRPHGVPVQAMPPLSQLLNIINNEANSDVPANSQDGEPNKENSNGLGHENGVSSKVENTSAEKHDQPPVGLGTGLASLHSRKQKLKPKPTS